MRATHRGEAAPLIERLLAAPQEFEFVQAVRILLGWLADRGVAPEQALRSHLRFENSLRLGFPSAELEALAPVRAGGAAGAGEGVPGFALTPAFMGLLGVHGTQPLHLTQRIAAWQLDHGDEAPRAFLDLLSGRMLALFYGAWHKHRIAYRQPGEDDRFQPLLLALAGMPQGGRPAAAAGVPDALLAHFAGMLGQRPRPAAVLERLLASWLGEQVRLEEAVGHWSPLAAGEQAALGVNARLGENVLLGQRSWRPDLRARLRIGPLGREAYARLLPGGPAAGALRALLALVAEPTVGFEVQLVLRAADVTPGRLAGGPVAPARLGRDGFLLSGSAGSDRGDLRYLVQPKAPLPPPAAARRPTRGG